MIKNHFSFEELLEAEQERERQLAAMSEALADEYQEDWENCEQDVLDDEQDEQDILDVFEFDNMSEYQQAQQQQWDKPWNRWRQFHNSWEEYIATCEWLGIEIDPSALPF